MLAVLSCMIPVGHGRQGEIRFTINATSAFEPRGVHRESVPHVSRIVNLEVCLNSVRHVLLTISASWCPQSWKNERVRLMPFDVSLNQCYLSLIHTHYLQTSVHAKLHVDAAPPVSFYDYLIAGPFADEEDLISTFWEKRINNGPGETAFAVYDKPKV